MTIENLMDNVKFDFSTKNSDFTQKNYSKDSAAGFSNIFESANKSYNFSFNKTEKFSYKNLKQFNENKNLSSKVFKSDYENFHNKIDNLIRKEAFSKAKEAVAGAKDEKKEVICEVKETVSEAKEEKKEVLSEAKEAVTEAKETVSEAKEEKKEVLSEAKKAVAEAKEAVAEVKDEIKNLNPQENINTAVIVENIDLNQIPQLQTVPQITDEANVVIQKDNNTAELPAESPEKGLSEELTAIQKQIANEKITNKLAGNILQQQFQEVEEQIPQDQAEITGIKPEELKKTDEKTADQNVKQTQTKKTEILVSEDVLNKLNTVDKNQIKQPQGENLKPVSEKLAEILNNEEAKPVITNIQAQNNSSKTDSGDLSQNQKQAKQELKPNINQIQAASPDDNNLQKIDLQKTSHFDKILNAKQPQTLENSVLNQLKDKISSDIATNKSQITIALRPDNLGKVNINLVSQDGILTAQITAESKQVKDILSKGLETLRQNMAEQGITVGKMVVNVQEPSASSQNMNSEDNQKNFEQANSNTSNMNYQSDKQNRSNESASASNNQLYEFEEELENENEMNKSSVLAGQSSVLHSGTVDYKV